MNEQDTVTERIIARIHTEFPSKFGIPRQSGLVPSLRGEIVLEPPYRSPDALRGLDGYSHLWLLWHFSEAVRDGFTPTVRPPRLGGNRRMGVFATRSPFRPSPIGLSSVRLCGLLETPDRGTVLLVEGADLMDGTPILDIKPYLAMTDSHPDAVGGFSDAVRGHALRVVFAPGTEAALPADCRETLTAVLAEDPRPSYQDDPAREYGFPFAGYEIRFAVAGDTLTVRAVQKAGGGA